MPFDQKRINGPEETLPYELFARINTKTLAEELEQAYQRTDLRNSNGHRKVFLKTGVVSQAKGSSYIELGNTKVIVSVFDPREIPNRIDYSLKGEIFCEFKFAPFSCIKRRLHQQDNEEKHYSAIMKKALESVVCRHEFPNFQVDIYALVLHNDGSALSAAITAAGLALSHASVPMYDIITSVSIGVQGKNKFMDPNLKEQNLCELPISSQSHGIIVISIMHTHNQISQFHQSGNMAMEELNDSIKLLQENCNDLVPLIQKSLAKHVIKSNNNYVEN